MNLLALLRRVAPPVPPRADPPCEVDDAVAVWEVPGLYRWEGPDRCELAEEDRLLDLVAVLVGGGASPWDAAVAVFGGAAVTRDAPRAGLYATVAGEAGGSAPR